ncbi:hypothetical protein A3A71_02385 [Candidatus Berkelbacteria bacterium RIFCSPLOWO2_01_FULL_50_28]|uniref:Phosphoribosylanthranilate isomerase n=1 Tax=Candidatus Berkelbacteria bacterium RIFCSPLOWO2_01_FULL_50_28 TaxID=1797471 RepID=A0A1F5EC48_9BACT|nr:MAG: hypothetical protein A2807_00780 [Candidatus Berkelbacteria bacterium RIFCSPHIGHO2_01_FULL_50_36]OGD62228.1 MAG: hypothetical protein A3F39_00800 [Candidatus Berkelbacteria bacterium RIFCSPHIGHO2_12_FULL_50_11]OGD64870.1 MAG: hypothetical protein A3A71_02385 [Candidatus Berkelbacteria bacterium RIFCSPLOWO2_01_FULL_50_28]
MNPYIGITDFTTIGQVREMIKLFRSNQLSGLNRMLHVGVMMSYKTLHGIPSKWQAAFPAKENIAAIFGPSMAYNCLHYADYDNNPDLWKSLDKAISFGGLYIDALQLDMVWPDPGQVANGVDLCRKPIEVILQIGKNALDEVDNDPRAVVGKLADYEGVIHRVLLDKSMGKGLGMDAGALIPFARAIRERFPTLGIGAAGGLGPETIHLVEPLVREFPDLSIDAQGRLRPSGNALDPIDWKMAGTYLTKAQQIFA